MRKSLIIFALLSTTFIYCAIAQDAVMNVRCRQSAAAGQPFQITFEVNAKASNFKTPSFKNLRLIGSPSSGFSSSMSFINGKMSRSETQTFTILVQAEEEGTAYIGAATCTVDGKTVSSKPFTITIEKAQANPNNNQRNQGWGQQQQQQRPQPAQPQSTTIDNNTLFARASINKSNLYQGEEAIIVYKIYTQVPLTQFQIEQLPRNKGFWSEDLSEGKTEVRQYSETYNGRQYQVAEIRRGALYPQSSGVLTIAPLKTDVVAIIQTQVQRQRTGTIFDFFIDDPFFTPTQSQAVVHSLTSNSISVNVKPLPDAPDGFYGGVGNFSVKAKTDLKELKANEAFIYSVTINGRGNLSLLEAPQIDFPQGMEVYEPRVIDNINKGDNGLSGSRTFEWIVTPQTQGEYVIPAFDYIYFDPASGNYVTKKVDAIHIKVNKGVHTATSKSDVKELNSDIHHIQKQTRLHPMGHNSHPSTLFWILLVIPFLTALVVILWFRRQQDIAEDEASMRLQRATKLARKRLRNAEKHLHDNNDALFYEEIYKALWGGIADKFNIQLSLLSSDTISQHLKDKQVSEELQQRILQTLTDVDFARFAPGDSSAKKQSIYEEAMLTITQIAAIKVKNSRQTSNVISLLLIVATLGGGCLQAAEPNESMTMFYQANAAYDSGSYQEAAAQYKAILAQGYESWQLYYNLGNAYYRLDSLGYAILNYERALLLSPTNRLVKDNLALARSHTVDNIEEVPQLFLKEWFLSILHVTTPQGWRIIIIILFTLLCLSASLFFIAKRYKTRRSMFVINFFIILLLVISVINAAISAKKATNSSSAIVTTPMVVVKSSPDPKSVDKFILHEGTKMTITDQQDQWMQIEIADGKTGWISNGAEKI